MAGEEDRRLTKFIEGVRKRFRHARILLFGSRARGDYLRESDYDLLIISKDFESLDFRERIIEVYKLLEDPLNVEVICLTPKEFEARKNELSIIGVVAKEGKAVA